MMCRSLADLHRSMVAPGGAEPEPLRPGRAAAVIPFAPSAD
jgi:hypothetical protein